MANGCLGIVYHAIDSLYLLCHFGEGQNAADHNYAANDPGNNAEGHIAFGFFQNGLRFKKDPASNHNADYHTDGGEQAVALFKLV